MMQKKYHVKKNDEIKVLSGKWKDEEGKILAVLKKKDRVVLELNDLSPEKRKQIGTRTTKPRQNNQKGSMVERAVSVHVSNVKKKSEEKHDR